MVNKDFQSETSTRQSEMKMKWRTAIKVTLSQTNCCRDTVQQERLSPDGNDANFPSPSGPLLSLPSPFPLPALSLPSLPFSPSLPRGSGAEPPMAGVRRCHPRKMEIEIGFGAFWRIFVPKRQLSSVSLFVNTNWHSDVAVFHFDGQCSPKSAVMYEHQRCADT